MEKSNNLNDIAEHILTLAKKAGASDAEVGISQSSGFNLQVRLGEVETLEHNRDNAVGITVYFDHKKGSTSISTTEPNAIVQAVEAACHIAKYTSPDDYAGLPEKSLLAFNYPELDLYHVWNITPIQGIELAKQCEEEGRATDKRITNSEGCSLSTHDSIEVYANSLGFCGNYRSTYHSMFCTLIAQEGSHMQRDYGYTIARDFHDLAKTSSVAQEAATRTLRRLNARRLKTCKAPVIFSADMSRSLIGNFLTAIRGSNLYRKTTFLLDALHKPVFPTHVTITENPHLLKGIASAPFDSEGVRTEPRDLISNGVLQSYILSTYSARKLGLHSTGNAGGAHNIFVKPQDLNFNQLLKKMGTGLVVTELLGQGVNIITGDYSRGASGFWVENGEIQFPVEEITIASNLRDIFSHVIALGNDIDPRGSIQTGSILIEQMMIAGE